MIVEDEEARAFRIVSVIEKGIVIRQAMADEGHEGKPGRGFGRRVVQASADQGVVGDRLEFMSRNARRQNTDGAFDRFPPIHGSTRAPIQTDHGASMRFPHRVNQRPNEAKRRPCVSTAN